MQQRIEDKIPGLIYLLTIAKHQVLLYGLFKCLAWSGLILLIMYLIITSCLLQAYSFNLTANTYIFGVSTPILLLDPTLGIFVFWIVAGICASFLKSKLISSAITLNQNVESYQLDEEEINDDFLAIKNPNSVGFNQLGIWYKKIKNELKLLKQNNLTHIKAN